MPERPGPSRFAEKLRRHEPMLGALVAAQRFSPGLVSGLDVVVLAGPLPLGVLALLRALPVMVVMLVESDDEIAAAVAAGFDATIAATASVLGADVVLSERGAARLVESPAAARTAFATGADLVLYDLSAMLDTLLASLVDGRPAVPERSGREPLVLLSGMLGDESLWDEVVEQLAELILPWPARIDRDASVPELAASVLAGAPRRFALAGHSLGAIVALEIIRQAPERVARLALVNASGRGPSQAQQNAWDEWRQRTHDGGFDELAAELALATLATAHRGDTSLVARNERMARTVGGQGFLRQLSAQTTRPDSLGSLGAVEVPVLVVSGELDEICPPALQRELVERCPGAEHVCIAGAGHMVPLEAPAALAGHLRSWLR